MTKHPCMQEDGEDLYYRKWDCGNGPGSGGGWVDCDDTSDGGYCDEFTEVWMCIDSNTGSYRCNSISDNNTLLYDQVNDWWEIYDASDRSGWDYYVYAICKKD